MLYQQMSNIHTILYLKKYKIFILRHNHKLDMLPQLQHPLYHLHSFKHQLYKYLQFAIIEYMPIQQLYFSNKYKYTHKASAIILTRVGTAFINLCPTSVPSPSWCTVTLVTIHHVLGHKEAIYYYGPFMLQIIQYISSYQKAWRKHRQQNQGFGRYLRKFFLLADVQHLACPKCF